MQSPFSLGCIIVQSVRISCGPAAQIRLMIIVTMPTSVSLPPLVTLPTLTAVALLSSNLSLNAPHFSSLIRIERAELNRHVFGDFDSVGCDLLSSCTLLIRLCSLALQSPKAHDCRTRARRLYYPGSAGKSLRSETLERYYADSNLRKVLQYAGAAATIFSVVAGGNGDSGRNLVEHPSEMATYAKVTSSNAFDVSWLTNMF